MTINYKAGVMYNLIQSGEFHFCVDRKFERKLGRALDRLESLSKKGIADLIKKDDWAKNTQTFREDNMFTIILNKILEQTVLWVNCNLAVVNSYYTFSLGSRSVPLFEVKEVEKNNKEKNKINN